MADTPQPLDDLLCFAIYAAGHAFTRVYKPLLDAIGLTYPQYLVMVTLWQSDDQTVGQIAGRLLLESSTLTPLLKRLEAAGHVQRRRDATDERQVRVKLTRQGAALNARAAHIPTCILDAAGGEGRELVLLTRKITSLRRELESKGSSFSEEKEAKRL